MQIHNLLILLLNVILLYPPYTIIENSVMVRNYQSPKERFRSGYFNYKHNYFQNDDEIKRQKSLQRKKNVD